MKKLYKLIALFLLLFTCSCGVTVKSFDNKVISALKVRVEVQNKTYEAGVTYIMKDACEASLVRQGATIVDVNEDYLILLVVKEIKAIPISFSTADIATNYNLFVNGGYKIVKVAGKERKVVLEDSFSTVQNYSAGNAELTEIKRQLSIMQAAYEISESIKDRLSMLQ